MILFPKGGKEPGAWREKRIVVFRKKKEGLKE